MQFPKFTIRDMVQSQYRLMKEKLGIDHVVAVVGPSMGGMQALQWAASYPDMMDSIVPIIPLGRTPAWTTGILEMLRQSIMADPRWLDPTVDPNDRAPGTCYLGDPEVVNMSPVGLARFCTLRSWLSQWSYDESNAKGIADAANMSLPTLVISNAADDACTPSHARRLFDAVANSNKEFVEISGATHYYLGQHEQLRQAEQTCTHWLRRQGLTTGP